MVETTDKTDDASWAKSSWRRHPAKQQPEWVDAKARDATLGALARLPSLVFAGESRSLKQELAAASRGQALILQAGDCAEDFSRCHGPSIHSLLRVILQMSIVLTYAGEKRVVKIGRIAGQYAKPRSSDTESIGALTLPSYRGDMVNGSEPTPEDRVPNPRRMLEGYFRAAATLNLVRAFTSGGYASLGQAHAWSEASINAYAANRKYEDLVKGIEKAIHLMGAVGIDSAAPQLNQVTVYTSHEALLLEYEEAMTRIDTTTGDWYDTSANMLWIGDRTRQPDGAHVEFLRGVNNPVGVKIGPGCPVDDVKRLAERLNPDNEPGRLSLVTRLGVGEIAKLLPPLIREVSLEGIDVVWICDPMHGNTYTNRHSQKTRRYADIVQEIRQFWHIHQAEGTTAGGVHLELTGDAVTECSGGSRNLHEDDLQQRYQTSCDPRLNAEQAVELAFELAEIANA